MAIHALSIPTPSLPTVGERAAIERLIEGLIAYLDALDAPTADREPEPETPPCEGWFDGPGEQEDAEDSDGLECDRCDDEDSDGLELDFSGLEPPLTDLSWFDRMVASDPPIGARPRHNTAPAAHRLNGVVFHHPI